MTRDDLDRHLREPGIDTTPPDDLLARLRADLPSADAARVAPPLHPHETRALETRRGSSRRLGPQALALAAALFVALGAGFVVSRLDAPIAERSQEAVAESRSAAAAAPADRPHRDVGGAMRQGESVVKEELSAAKSSERPVEAIGEDEALETLAAESSEAESSEAESFGAESFGAETLEADAVEAGAVEAEVSAVDDRAFDESLEATPTRVSEDGVRQRRAESELSRDVSSLGASSSAASRVAPPRPALPREAAAPPAPPSVDEFEEQNLSSRDEPPVDDGVRIATNLEPAAPVDIESLECVVPLDSSAEDSEDRDRGSWSRFAAAAVRDAAALPPSPTPGEVWLALPDRSSCAIAQRALVLWQRGDGGELSRLAEAVDDVGAGGRGGAAWAVEGVATRSDSEADTEVDSAAALADRSPLPDLGEVIRALADRAAAGE